MEVLKGYSMKFELHQGDCLDVLKTLADCSVDAIVTDPPYGISFQSAWVEKDKRKKRVLGDDHPFVWFLPESFRVLKDNCFLVCFHEWRHAEAFRSAIEWSGFRIKSQGVWDRDWHGMGDLTGGLAPCHDLFWLASKGKAKFHGDRLKSVIRARRVAPDDLVHPTEKPSSLIEQIARAITPPGGIVLDPFTGSGSTGKAAMAEGFRFIGIEREAEYVEIARARISAEAEKPRQLSLF
jgi:site-specific DNA-methyltransferase (adenine-specific)